MNKFYSKNLELKQSTVNKLLQFSQSISAIKTNLLQEKIIVNMN